MGLLNLLSFVWRHPLNARGRMAAILRVLQWQLLSRFKSGPISLPFVEGTRLYALRGMTGATGNWYCGLHEVEEMGFVLHLLRPGDHFVDVGANIGSYAVLAAGGVGARVTSIEPIPETFIHLERNIANNGLEDRVRACRMGLSSGASTLRFTSGLDTVNHVLTEHEAGPFIEVPVVKLDDLLGDDAPTLIKIDVEGHERSVLLGAVRTLSDPRLLAVIMETNGSGLRYGVSDDELLKIMKEHGFRPFGYDPFERRIIAFDPSHGNTVFIRDEATVRARVDSAKRYRLINGTI